MRVSVDYDEDIYVDFNLSEENEVQLQKVKEFLHSLNEPFKVNRVSFNFTGEIKVLNLNDDNELVPIKQPVTFAKVIVEENHWFFKIYLKNGYIETSEIKFD
jgi:hypothetical protein